MSKYISKSFLSGKTHTELLSKQERNHVITECYHSEHTVPFHKWFLSGFLSAGGRTIYWALVVCLGMPGLTPSICDSVWLFLDMPTEVNPGFQMSPGQRKHHLCNLTHGEWPRVAGVNPSLNAQRKWAPGFREYRQGKRED